MEMDQKKKKVCIDFDGVLAEYHGWEGEHHHGKPLPGVKAFLEKLRMANIDVIVLTSRESKEHILAWFKRYGLPIPVEITNRKIPANAYIDDRAVYFDGNFDHLLKTLRSFKVYWSQKQPFKALTTTKE